MKKGECVRGSQPTLQRPTSLHGFTLIELLVVVAIIVTLLAILLPSMGRAVATAQLATCASNLHQQGTAVGTYAVDSFGILPPHAPDDSAPYRVNNTWDLSYGHDTTYPIDPATGRPTRRFNLSLLVDTSHLVDPRVLYCPGDPQDIKYDFDSYPDPWGAVMIPSISANAIRLGYAYNPQVNASNELATQRRVLDLNSAQALTTDYFEWPTRWSHTAIGGWNLLMGDSSVRFTSDAGIGQEIIDYRGLWPEFNDRLQRLERGDGNAP